MSNDDLEFGPEESLADMQDPVQCKPGTYHMSVVDIREVETDGIVWMRELKFQIWDGTVPGQSGKTVRAKFLTPQDTHKDGGATAKKFQKVLALALGYVAPTFTGRKSLEWGQLVDLQLIAKVKSVPWDKGQGSSMEIDGTQMWHIDHPEVAAVPKSASLLANCLGCRWTPADIAAATVKHEKVAVPASRPVEADL